MQSSKFDCLLFDLDDTLYPSSSRLSDACGQNIQDFMVEKLGIDRTKTSDIGNLLYTNYGTTMEGLKAIGYDFDYDEYYSFVHGKLPYENLKPDPILRNLLISLPIRKVIFTNADKVHATKVLNRLGLEDCFDGFISFETLNPIQKNTESRMKPTGNNEIFDIVTYFSEPNQSFSLPQTTVVCKPSQDAIELALKIENINPHTTLFFEDSVRNLQSGKRLGLHTVLVGSSKKVEGCDYAIESIHNVKEAIPELWKDKEDVAQVSYAGEMAVETFVTA
ncbi:suppressor of disruption of TFIIS-like [Impatiens glandulifera]|uniref:suppressor of disruption of TFIIS-like n=1 Tax=Impatiens glandulifera TaxID=253017 RepID=UPI001FB06CF1|nr:suppressor of disruption of TFIIS-like [Impatiens glandulifera]